MERSSRTYVRSSWPNQIFTRPTGGDIGPIVSTNPGYLSSALDPRKLISQAKRRVIGFKDMPTYNEGYAAKNLADSV